MEHCLGRIVGFTSVEKVLQGFRCLWRSLQRAQISYHRRKAGWSLCKTIWRRKTGVSCRRFFLSIDQFIFDSGRIKLLRWCISSKAKTYWHQRQLPAVTNNDSKILKNWIRGKTSLARVNAIFYFIRRFQDDESEVQSFFLKDRGILELEKVYIAANYFKIEVMWDTLRAWQASRQRRDHGIKV